MEIDVDDDAQRKSAAIVRARRRDGECIRSEVTNVFKGSERGREGKEWNNMTILPVRH